MELLVLSTWHPYPPDNGARLRAWHLLRALAARHRVRLIVGRQDDAPTELPSELLAPFESVQAVPWQWFTGSGGGVRALLDPVPRSIRETPNPALSAAIDAELARKPELALVMQLGMDAYVPETKVPLVLEEAEVSLWSHAKGPRAWLTRAKAYRYWKQRLGRYRAITAASASEADAIRAVLGGNRPPVHVVPNGVDAAHYLRPTRPIAGRLLYNGALSYGPNRDAVYWFVEEILPKVRESVPEAQLIVTGRVPDDCRELAQNPGVCLTGYLDDIRTALAEASVCVVPLRAGGGTRLKILEAWAAGVPVVSTPIGAAGLAGSENNRELLIAEDASDFAESVVGLLTDSARRESLASAARTLASSDYDWSVIGERLDTVLEGAIA
jgi:polysaccharide biosynthesis protein PslH